MKTQNPVMRWWDPLAAAIVAAALLTSATRLVATSWTLYLERAQYLVLLGLVMGLLLGQSRFSGGIVRLLGLAYTLFVIPWQLGSTIQMVDPIPWHDRLWFIGTRLGMATGQFLRSEVVHDPILFLTLMCLLFWIIGIVSGYYLTRYGQPWVAILTAGITMVIVSHYDPALSTWGRYVFIFVFLSLMLLGRMTYVRYRAEWQSTGVMPAPGASLDLGRAALFAVVALVLVAWTVPAVGNGIPQASELWVKVSKPWESLRHRFSDAFSSLQASVGVVSDFYGDSLALGTGSRLGNDVVFTVKASVEPPDGARYYWKDRSYDSYSNGNWGTTDTITRHVTPDNFKIAYPAEKARQEVTFTVTSQVVLLKSIYTSPMPTWVSRAGDATVSRASDGSEDVTLINATPPLHAGETYQTRGLISVPTVAELRQSAANYPASITDEYLQIPDGFPKQRFAELANFITEGLTTPYDKTEAITQYLRRTITYSETIDTPPTGVEPLEWFLFDYKQGYCNYYASAEVMLLRSIGIPARLAVGFAQGQAAKDAPVYTVTYKDSHAWPEVYFKDYGWVEFEPTVSQPQRVLPLGGAQEEGNPLAIDPRLRQGGPRDPFGEDRNFGGGGLFGTTQNGLSPAEQRQIFGVGSLLVGVLVVGLGWRMARTRYHFPEFPIWLESSLSRRGVAVPGWLRRWSTRVKATPMARAYGTLNQSLRLLGKAPRVSDTPAERAEALSQILPDAAAPAQAVLVEYQTSQYSPYIGNLGRIRVASAQVRKATYREVLDRIGRATWRRVLRFLGR